MAKHVNIVIVKLPPIDDMLSVSRVIAVWGIIANDVASNNLQSKAVVCNTLAGERNLGLGNLELTF